VLLPPGESDPVDAREGIPVFEGMDEAAADFRGNDGEADRAAPAAGGTNGTSHPEDDEDGGNANEARSNMKEEEEDPKRSSSEGATGPPLSSDAPRAPAGAGGAAAPVVVAPAPASVPAVVPVVCVSTRRGGTRGSAKAAAASAAGGPLNSSAHDSTSSAAAMDATAHAALVQASAILAQQGYRAVSALIHASLAASGSSTGSGSSTNASGSSAGTATAAAAAAAAASASGAAGAGAGAGATTSQTGNAVLGDADALLAALHSGAVESAAHKLVVDTPPWVHWSRSDTAPQLKIAGGASKTTLLGSYRGYRMGRASAGLSSGNHYYEVVIMPAPTAQEIYAQLPPSARLGPGLEAMLKLQQEQEQEDREQKEQQKEQQQEQQQSLGQSNHSASSTAAAAAAPAASEMTASHHLGKRVRVGGHVRLGWSMRTGELQAPVGYDKWSYAIRDLGGSLVHKSHRQDSWWSGYDSIEFGPGDVVGCALCLDTTDDPHIRFFLNGECLGHFVISKGKRVGGVAFTIEPGCYYPAVSLYMGGGVRANFGPNWIYPPKKLPTGFPKLQPVSASVPVPQRPHEAVEACSKALKLLQALKRPEYARAVKAALEAEAKVRCDAYDRYYLSQLEFVHNEREDRGLTTNDLKEKLQQLQTQQGPNQAHQPQPTPSSVGS
jgi:SPRY domain